MTTLTPPLDLAGAIRHVRDTGHRATTHVCNVATALAEVGIAAVPDIVHRAGVPQSTAYRALNLLEHAGAAIRVVYRDRSLYAIARPGMTVRRFEQCAACGNVDEVDPNYQPTKAQRRDLVSIIELVTNAAHTCTHHEAAHVA